MRGFFMAPKITHDSTLLYKKTLDGVGAFLAETQRVQTDKNKKKAVSLLKNASRIFFTGSGSSIPAAMFAGRYASQAGGLPAQFATTSQLVGEEKLGKNDVVVLVSQGWNRSDAVLITDHVLRKKARLIGLTGNAESSYPAKSDALYYFYPPYKNERLFCRPSSVISSYALLADLVSRVWAEEFSYRKAQNAVTGGLSKGKTTKLPQADRYVLLSSGLGMPAATNVCLAMREGAGLSTFVYEIESYGHGWYVPDQLYREKGGKLHYVLITHENDAQLTFALKRIMPLFDKTKSSYDIWSTSYDSLYGNMEILARGAALVYELITASGYDMNFPPGKEENRYFHDLLLSTTK